MAAPADDLPPLDPHYADRVAGAGPPDRGADREADHHAIERLLFTYARRIDAGDFAGVGQLFAEGTIATEDGTALATGAAAVEVL